MARNLKTGWVRIATSGVTVDYSDRVIEKDWLEAMAANYDPEVSAALLWPDHHRFYNGGKVLALKTEPATNKNLKDEIHLMAIISPNNWLIEANQEGQYIFTSIEVEKDYMDGKFDYYLPGLGVTDSPASAGVGELKFNAQNKEQHFFKPEPFNLAENIKRSFLDNFNFNNPDDDTMNLEQFNAIKALLDQQQAAFTVLTEQLASIQSCFTNKKEDGPDVPTPAGPITTDEPAPGAAANAFTVEQAKNLSESVAKLSENMEKMSVEFAALKENPAGGTALPEGDQGDANRVI